MKIMIVDDDVVCRKMASRAFTKFYPEALVDEAPDGILAVAQAVDAHRQRDPYQLILLDCHMPLMDGPETARLIRQYEAVHSLKPVSLCIISSDDMAHKLFANQIGTDPAIQFIVKPVMLAHLLKLYCLIQSHKVPTNE